MKMSTSNEQVRKFYNTLIAINEVPYMPAEAKQQAALFLALIQATNYDAVKDITVPERNKIYIEGALITENCPAIEKYLDAQKSQAASYIEEINESEYEGDFISLITLATAYAYSTKTRDAARGLDDVIEDATKFVNDAELQTGLVELGKRNDSINSLSTAAMTAVEQNEELLKQSGSSSRP